MNPVEFNECVDYCLDLKIRGKEYADIKLILKSKGLSEDVIKSVIKETDRKYLSELMETKSTSRHAGLITGVFLILFGLTITILTYIKAISFGGYYIIMYGPVFAGITLIFYNQRTKKNIYFNRKQDKWGRRF